MAANTAAFEEAMKVVWGPAIVEAVKTKTPMYDDFTERDARDWGGRYVEYPAVVARTEGVSATSEGGALPTAGQEKYQSFRIPMTQMHGRVSFTGFAMKASEGSRNAYASIMDREMKGLLNTLRTEMGRIIWGDGRGVLALVNTDPGNTTTVTVDSPGGVAGATNGCRFIRPGMIVTFIDPATGSLRASAAETVTAVAAAGTSFTIGSTAATVIADNDYIVRAANASVTDVSDTSYAKEPMGMLGHVDDGTYVSTYHNINRSAYPIFQSVVVTNSGAPSADLFQRGVDLVDQIVGGEVSEFWCHHSVRRSVIATTEDARRYMGADLSNPDPGTQAMRQRALTIGGIPLKVDRYAPYGTVFGFDKAGWYRYVLTAGEWINDDGAILARAGVGTAGVDAFEATWRQFLEFHIDEPGRSCRFDGVSATVSVAHIY